MRPFRALFAEPEFERGSHRAISALERQPNDIKVPIQIAEL
jgi:hypothetical protein